MAKNEAKVRFTAETGDFNNQIKQASTQMAKLSAEMKRNDAEMKATGATVDGLQQRQRLLTEQLTASQAKTEALSQKAQKAKEIYGENSQEVMKLETQLIKAQTAEDKLQRQIDACNQELEDQRAAANKAETATEQLSNRIEEQQKEVNKLKDEYKEAVLKFGATSDEAKELEGKIDALSGELKENKQVMADAAEAADKLDKSLDDTSDNDGSGFTVFKGALADLVSNGIQFAIGKVNELVDYMWGLPEATREIRQDFATLTTAFDNMGYSNETATKTWKELYGVFGEDDRAVETANNIAKIAANEEDLNKWVTITTGIWGTYQDSLPVEGLAEAANETAKVGTVTGGLADALNWSSEAATMFASYMSEDVVTAEDAFNEALKECNTEQERQRLITDTLTTLYGGAAETYREASGGMMEAKEATAENIIAENNLATAIEPVTTKWNEMTNTLKTNLLPVVEKVSEWAIGALSWMAEHPTLISAIAAAASVLAIGIGGLATAWGIYTVAQWAANSAMLASPITWIVLAIVAAIAALVAIIVVVVQKWDEIKAAFAQFGEWCNVHIIEPVSQLWSNIVEWFVKIKNSIVEKCTEVIDWVKSNWKSILLFFINPFAGLFDYFYKNNNKFKEFVNNAVNAIKELPSKVATWLTSTIQNVGSWISNMIQKAKEVGTNFVSAVVSFFSQLPSKIWTWLSNAIQNVVKWGSDLVSKGKQAATKLVSSVVDTIKKMPSKVATVGKDLVSGIWNGISNSLTWIKNKITGWVGNVTDFIKNLFGIESPSTVMRDEVGVWLARGIAEGITDEGASVEKAASTVADSAVEAADKTKEFEAAGEDNAKSYTQGWKAIVEDENFKTVPMQKLLADNKVGNSKELQEKFGLSTFLRMLVNTNDEFTELTNAFEGYREDYKIETKEFLDAEGNAFGRLIEVYKDGVKTYSKNIKFAAQETTSTNDTLMKKAEERLKKYKENNQISLADEVAYWNEVRKMATKGTEERIELDKKYAEVKKELGEKILTAEETLQTQLDDIAKKVTDRQREIAQSFDLFSGLNTEETGLDTSTELLLDLRAQIDGIEAYGKTLEELESKIGGTDLFEHLKNMGIDAHKELVLINQMTDYEIQQYAALYDERTKMAGSLAKQELEDDIIIETEKAYKDFAKTCSEVGVDVSGSISLMHINSTNSLESLYLSITSGIKQIKDAMKDLREELDMPSMMVSASNGSLGIEWTQSQVPAFAKGGILTKPMLNIAGEAGPEAIIPIDKLQTYISGAVERTMQVVNMQSLVNAIEDLANRAVELHINGQKFATATAGDTDIVNGSRMQLSKRGLAR